MKSVIAVAWVVAGVARASADPDLCLDQARFASPDAPLVVAYTRGTWIREAFGWPHVAVWPDGTIMYVDQHELEPRQAKISPAEAMRIAARVFDATRASPPSRASTAKDDVTVEILARDGKDWVRARVYGPVGSSNPIAADYGQAFTELVALVPHETRPYTPAEVEIRLSSAAGRATAHWPSGVPAIPAKLPAIPATPPAIAPAVDYSFVVPGKHWSALLAAFDWRNGKGFKTVSWNGATWRVDLFARFRGQVTTDFVRRCRNP
jgi:hypothetical protein